MQEVKRAAKHRMKQLQVTCLLTVTVTLPGMGRVLLLCYLMLHIGNTLHAKLESYRLYRLHPIPGARHTSMRKPMKKSPLAFDCQSRPKRFWRPLIFRIVHAGGRLIARSMSFIVWSTLLSGADHTQRGNRRAIASTRLFSNGLTSFYSSRRNPARA
jgi:hypothetical protein